MDGITGNSIAKVNDQGNFRKIKPNNRWGYLFVKRAFDICASGMFLLLFGWFILLLMLIKWFEDFGKRGYKLEIYEDENGKYLSKNGKHYSCKVIKIKNAPKDKSAHGPIYTSYRIGLNGKLIKFHKIRSMCRGAEEMKNELLKYGINEADEPMFKVKDDPRITPVGHFLRKFSLDELPQIWDIFVGRLSIIGPRNPLTIEYDKFTDYQKQKMLVKGGILCLWQIQHNRNQISFEDWIELDIKYAEKRNLWMDIVILVKGIWMVIFDHSGE